jgi:hypothetical protein
MPDEPNPGTSPGHITALMRRLILVGLVVICFDSGCSASCAGDSAERLTGGVRIEICAIYASEAGPEKGAARLWPEEMEVIRKLEPEASQAIYQRARASGEEAEEKARGCAASCGLPQC